MVVYNRIVNGISINRWTSDTGDATYTENGWGDPSTYTITQTDITAQLAQQAAVAQALANQQVGAFIIAQIAVLNDAKFAAGTLTVDQLQAMLQDPTCSLIQNLLWTGSLVTAKQLITNYSGSYFTLADQETILALMTNY